MSARSTTGAAYAHAADLLSKGEALPHGYAAWLAHSLANVARVLLDKGNAKPDSAVMVALGARGGPRGGSTADRDRQLVEKVEELRRENPGRPLKAIYQDVADEWPPWYSPSKWMSIDAPEIHRDVAALAAPYRVSWSVVRAAHQKPKA